MWTKAVLFSRTISHHKVHDGPTLNMTNEQKNMHQNNCRQKTISELLAKLLERFVQTSEAFFNGLEDQVSFSSVIF